MQEIQKFAERLKERLENASYWTMQTFDDDGFSNDDSEEVVDLQRANEIIDEVTKEFQNKAAGTSANIPSGSGWILCKERLPIKSGTYTVSIKKMIRGETFLAEDKCDYSIYDGWCTRDKIVAWRENREVNKCLY